MKNIEKTEVTADCGCVVKLEDLVIHEDNNYCPDCAIKALLYKEMEE